MIDLSFLKPFTFAQLMVDSANIVVYASSVAVRGEPLIQLSPCQTACLLERCCYASVHVEKWGNLTQVYIKLNPYQTGYKRYAIRPVNHDGTVERYGS